MSREKYIGLDVHQATISVAVMDSQGKLIMESILETKASTILEFLAGLGGTLSLTFEEGTWAAWLYDLLKPHVAHLIVGNPRKNALLKPGNKSDKIDARKLADRLRLHDLKPVYHGETGVRMLRELARSYLTVVKDLSRVMNRLKARYRSWAIPCAGRDVYYTRHRSPWLEKIPEAGTRRRAEQLYQQLDMRQHLRQQARRELLAESRKHTITAKLRQIPSLGPIRSALAVALIQTPHRFRSKRQLWTYSGLGLETRDSGEYHFVKGQPRRRKKWAQGDVVVVRYADDIILGFQHQTEADRFLENFRERLGKFGLELHPDKTRRIEFGRYAEQNRERRGEGKPETFDFLGFTHISGKNGLGRFMVRRTTIRKRMRAKLRQVKQQLRERMHDPVPQTGQWLKSVVQGYFNYYAVPGNLASLGVFRDRVLALWWRTLRRRSQKRRISWTRILVLAQRWFPQPRALHPFPGARFAASHPR